MYKFIAMTFFLCGFALHPLEALNQSKNKAVDSQAITMTLETLCDCPTNRLSLVLNRNGNNVELGNIITDVKIIGTSDGNATAIFNFNNPKDQGIHTVGFGSSDPGCKSTLSGSNYVPIENGGTITGGCS